MREKKSVDALTAEEHGTAMDVSGDAVAPVPTPASGPETVQGEDSPVPAKKPRKPRARKVSTASDAVAQEPVDQAVVQESVEQAVVQESVEQAVAQEPVNQAVAQEPADQTDIDPAMKPARAPRRRKRTADDVPPAPPIPPKLTSRREKPLDELLEGKELPVYEPKPADAAEGESPAVLATSQPSEPLMSQPVQVPTSQQSHEQSAPRMKRGKQAAASPAQAPAQVQQSAQVNNRRRNRRTNGHEPVVPQITREEIEAMKIGELREKAAELEIDASELRKKDALVDAVFEELLRKEGFILVEGLLDILPEGYGFLRTNGYLPGEGDVYVGQSAIRRNGLRKGDMVAGQSRPARDNEKYPALHRIDTVNGVALAESFKRPKFADLTPIYPDERLMMEHGKNTITARTIDLVAPIGKGQRGLIVSPPKAGKTTILKDIAAAISANNPEVHLMCLLVDERPEEVTDMERSIKGEVISSTFDMPCENHIAVTELVIERAKRLVELGGDVVILMDSITRLARAYNLAQPASGRILSGGVDSTALYPPKRFLGAARNFEFGGSLTILASALIETGSKMDEVIFEEFKGTGNMELRLDRALADRRIFPAIDPIASGTRKEELLLDPQEAPFVWGVRRILANMNNTERAMDMLIKSLKQTENNQEFLVRTAKKSQEKGSNSIEI